MIRRVAKIALLVWPASVVGQQDVRSAADTCLQVLNDMSVVAFSNGWSSYGQARWASDDGRLLASVESGNNSAPFCLVSHTRPVELDWPAQAAAFFQESNALPIDTVLDRANPLFAERLQNPAIGQRFDIMCLEEDAIALVATDAVSIVFTRYRLALTDCQEDER